MIKAIILMIPLYPLMVVAGIAGTAIGVTSDFIDHSVLRRKRGPHIERDWAERSLLVHGPSNSRK